MAVLDRETEQTGGKRFVSGKSRSDMLRERAAALTGGRESRPDGEAKAEGQEPRAESREPGDESREPGDESRELRAESQEPGDESSLDSRLRGNDGLGVEGTMDGMDAGRVGRIREITVGVTRKVTRNYNSTEYHAGATVELSGAEPGEADRAAEAFAAGYAMCREAVRAEFVRGERERQEARGERREARA